MDKNIIDFFDSIKGKKIALIGLGRSHMPLISLFTKYGAIVYACDKRTKEELNDAAQKAERAGARLSLGENYLDNLDVDIALRTPGMRYYSDELMKLRAKGVEISSEMELFFKLCPCKIIAVTGSDGKTTTTTLISEMLKKQGKTVHLGGNIGKPLLPEIESVAADDFAVVELSSFQLISMRQSPDISVVTNLQPNHLDIHKDMQEYIDAKKNIILYQNKGDKAIFNLDNEISNSFEKYTCAEVLKFSRKNAVLNGCYLKDGKIIYAESGKELEIMPISIIKIPGLHNVENYMAAICAVWGIVDIDNIIYVAKNFGGVAHRAEFVRELNGVKYYNDSIASSPTRTASGTLSIYDDKIILISGGYDKHLDYTDLGDIICKRVKVLILLGDTSQKIKTATVNSKFYSEKDLKIFQAYSMEEAVNFAKDNAQSGDIVSLSPASASFDLYKNFEQRGNHFKDIVLNL